MLMARAFMRRHALHASRAGSSTSVNEVVHDWLGLIGRTVFATYPSNPRARRAERFTMDMPFNQSGFGNDVYQVLRRAESLLAKVQQLLETWHPSVHPDPLARVKALVNRAREIAVFAQTAEASDAMDAIRLFSELCDEVVSQITEAHHEHL